MKKLQKASGFLILAVLGLTGCSALGAPTGSIAFETYRDGNAEVYLMDESGENLLNLTDHEAYDGTPDWSPDGSQIAFTSEREGNPDIYIMDSKGGDLNRVTDGGGYNVVPAWSPDGSRILFSSNRTYRRIMDGGQLEIPGNTKLWTVDLASGEVERISSGFGLDIYGSWSPDSESVVFMSARDADPEIYIKEPDRGAFNITNHEALDLNPSWSPDGTKVAFMSDRTGNMEIYILDVAGDGELINISNHDANDGDPSWSPDGKKLVFTSDRDGNIEIYVMSADGSGVVRLTNDPADDIHPRWQP